MSNRAAILMAAALSIVSGRAALAECGMAMGSHGDHDAGDHDAVEGHHEAAPAYRSPGLAAVLSLTPLPVDFGNFYTDNVGWGVAYTALELGLAAPMMWLAADRGMGHGSGAANGWSSGDRNVDDRARVRVLRRQARRGPARGAQRRTLQSRAPVAQRDCDDRPCERWRDGSGLVALLNSRPQLPVANRLGH